MKKAILFLTAIFYLLSSASSNAQGNSLLWKISGNGIASPSYIYGTMHSKDSRVFHFADSVMTKFEECDAFAMEVILTEDVQLQLMKNLLMDSGYVLKDLVSPAQYDSVDQFCRRNLGYSVSQFDRLKPIYTSVILAQATLNDTAKAPEREHFLDEYFQHVAMDEQKNVYGLETVDEQMKVFDLLNYRQQADLMMKSIRSENDDTTSMETMISLYTSNDLARMMKFENDFDLPDTIYNSLFTLRNHRMADRIDTMIRRRSTFVAVGAGHLGGETGLVNLLRNRGYTVIPVIPSYGNYLQDGWYRFVSTKRKFSAEFPEMPKPSMKGSGKDSGVASYLWSSNSTNKEKALTVGVATYTNTPSLDDELVYIQSALKARMQSDISLDKTTIRWKGYSALKAHGNFKEKGEAEILIIEDGNTVYTMSYATPGKINQKDKDRFFNSLQIFN